MIIENYVPGSVLKMRLNGAAPSMPMAEYDRQIMTSTHAVMFSEGNEVLVVLVSTVRCHTAEIRAVLSYKAGAHIFRIIRKIRQFAKDYLNNEHSVNMLIAKDVETDKQRRWMELIGFKPFKENIYTLERKNAIR